MLLSQRLSKTTCSYALFISFVFIISSSIAQSINPILKIKTSGAVTDFIIDGSAVLLSTDAGTIETYNLNTGEQTNTIQLPPIKDFMGDEVPAKIYSIDKISSQIVVLTQGLHGFRNALLIENGKTVQLISAENDKLMLKKGRFVNETQVLFGLLSNELVLFDIEKMEELYKQSITPYSFSDYSLSANHQFVFTSDESGVVHKIAVNDGKIVREYTGNNVDNIYQLVTKGGIIITAGQDRRVGIYNTITKSNDYLQKDFLVYSVGLSADATTGAFCASEENDITVFDINDKTELKTLKGHSSVVTKIEFIDNQTIVTAGDDGYLKVWKIN